LRNYQDILEAIQQHPGIALAAIIGSQARNQMVDQYSDLDVLVLARDITAVRDVPTWFPNPQDILICEFHLASYCTVLLKSFEKIDLNILPVDQPPSTWIVHDYRVIKGNERFAAQLAAVAAETRTRRAAHLNPDVCLDNVLLLVVTAWHRVKRGELLSAHGFLAMACDMVAALERRQQGSEAAADFLDPRRRLERSKPGLAALFHECLFAPPERGINRLAQALVKQHQGQLNHKQQVVLEYLSGP
jgi:predicted nucleotidyltransferase